jgi:hypothetical protein
MLNSKYYITVNIFIKEILKTRITKIVVHTVIRFWASQRNIRHAIPGKTREIHLTISVLTGSETHISMMTHAHREQKTRNEWSSASN